MRPFYDQEGITIYHGDAREVLPALAHADAIITDPVWPNTGLSLAGANDPIGLFTEVAAAFPRLAHRVVVHLGCDSDPRFLSAIPATLPFFRTCWLEYVRPHYKGRILYTSDVAYVFGEPPPSRPGAHLIPGRMIQTEATRKVAGHSCPRHYQHVRWLVRWFARGVVIDPFAGTGTTLLACKNLGLPAIGVEVEERFCEIAANRLSQMVLPLGA